ncbi:TRAP-type C4-dicarboxylate transport system, small permease component [Cohaesibacter sp. ES.047]|uniref:TRAP transporter small permease n=1 Tax=Cohaesibacter sp. ES.047 TaxID=1798205 RepID=UPI000BB8EC6B|nr:TRAP transporter small permease [Cohaesibacter sp. ES.047]SNY92988.1 TRAP-type C4-dicarboxylate transport system, small permease component [Cohaesibacter sp. ES.047]
MSQDNQPETALPGVLGVVDVAIARLEAALLALGVILMATNTVANVIGRFVFQNSLFFSEELNRLLIVMITFSGISYAARHGRHIRMSAIFDKMMPPARKVMMIVIALVTAAVMFSLAYFSISYILTVAKSGRVLPALQIPVYWIYLWAPIGLSLTGLQYVLTAIKNVVSKDIYLSSQVLEGYSEDEYEI